MAHRLDWAAATAVILLAVLTCTLFPFNFSGHSFRSVPGLLSIGIGPDLSPDVAGNVLLLVPLGFTLAGFLERRRFSTAAALTAVLVASVCFSYTIEVAQRFLPGRFASLSDVVSNCAGGTLGFVGYSVWRGKHNALVVLGHLIFAILVSIPLQWSTTLRNWDADFPLMLGNEATGDRPWRGQVLALSILDRPISDKDVLHLSDGGTVSALFAESLVASYNLTDPCPCPDASGHLPPLVWTSPSDEVTAERDGRGVIGRWLETTDPVRYLTNRVKETSRFTLLVTAATSDPDQTGPARIVSVSTDPSYRNFTLGQEGRDLLFRLRTPLTGRNGDSVPLPLIVPDVFGTPAPRQVVITYDGLDLRAYLDGARSSHTIRLGLGAAALAPLLGRDPLALRLAHLLYYAVVFVPTGILLSLAQRSARRSHRIVSVPASVIASALLFETIVAATGSGIVSPSNLLWSTVFCAIGIVAVEAARAKAWAAMVHQGIVTRPGT